MLPSSTLLAVQFGYLNAVDAGSSPGKIAAQLRSMLRGRGMF